MKKNIRTIICGQLVPLLLTCGLAVAATKPELQKIRHTVISPTSEQVALQLNGSYSPKIFTLKDETTRIVFDFPDMTYGREIKAITTTNGTIVKRIRVGMHTEEALKTRIVFDVPSAKGITFAQKFDIKSSTLVIQFSVPAKAAAAGTKTAAAEKNQSRAMDTVQDVEDQKNPLPETAQAQPEATADAEAVVKTQTAPTESSTKPSPEPKETSLQPSVNAERADEKKPPVAPAQQVQPEATAGTKSPIKTKTDQSESVAESQPEIKTSQKPAATAEKTEEKKTPVAATASPQPDTATGTKTPAQKEMAKLPVTAGSVVGPLLESVKFDGTSPKGEMVLFKLNDFHPPVIHGVEEGVPRVICDFNSTQLADSVKNLIKADGKFIKIIRITKHKKPDRIRVVLDLEPNRSYDLQQVFFKEDNLFVIIVNTVKK